MPKVGQKMSAEQKAKIAASLRARGLSPTKRCTRCGEVKPREEFGVRKNGYSRAECRACETARTKAYEARNRERRASWNRGVQLHRRFNMTIDDYEAMLAGQGGRCLICGAAAGADGKRLFIDHCHGTKKVRGLLCGACNTGLGMFRDDPDLLRAAIAYLARPIPDDAFVAMRDNDGGWTKGAAVVPA